jgi:hypothetical protein
MLAAVLGGALLFWQPGKGINLRAVLADMRRCLTVGDDAIEPAVWRACLSRNQVHREIVAFFFMWAMFSAARADSPSRTA